MNLTSRNCCVCGAPAKCQCPCGFGWYYCSTQCQTDHWGKVHRFDAEHQDRDEDHDDDSRTPHTETRTQHNGSPNNSGGQKTGVYQQGDEVKKPPGAFQQKVSDAVKETDEKNSIISETKDELHTQRQQQGEEYSNTDIRSSHDSKELEVYQPNSDSDYTPSDEESSDGPPDLVDFDSVDNLSTKKPQKGHGASTTRNNGRHQQPVRNSSEQRSGTSHPAHDREKASQTMNSWTCCGETHRTGPEIISHAVSHAMGWEPVEDVGESQVRKASNMNAAQQRVLSRLRTDLVGAENDLDHKTDGGGGRPRLARRASRYSVDPASRTTSVNDVDGDTSQGVNGPNTHEAHDMKNQLKDGMFLSTENLVDQNEKQLVSSSPGSPHLYSLLKHSCPNAGCEKKFGTMSDLKIHGRVCEFAEKEPKPKKKSNLPANLVCERCDRQFTRPVNLSQHMKRCEGPGSDLNTKKSKRDRKREKDRKRSRSRKRQRSDDWANAQSSSAAQIEADPGHIGEDYEDSDDQRLIEHPDVADSNATEDRTAQGSVLAASPEDPSLPAERPMKSYTSIKVKSPQLPSSPQPQYTTEDVEATYVCSYPKCGKAFTRKGHLKKHYKRHVANYPFPCPVEGCSLSYQANGSLTVHLRTHNLEAKR